MRLSLNLDEYLKKFRSLTFCQDLLDKYYETQLKQYYKLIGKDYDAVGGVEGLLILDDLSKYYYNTDNTEDYYQGLMESRFPILYRLVNNISIPSLTYKGVDYTPTWKDWYFIATNAYNIKGSIRSVYYVFTYLGIDILEQTDPKTGAVIDFYDKNYLSLRLSLALKTDSPTLVTKDIYSLCSELLLVNEEILTIDILYINYLVQNKTYLYINTFTNTFPDVDNQFVRGTIKQGNRNLSQEYRKYLEELKALGNITTKPDVNGYSVNEDLVDFLLDHTYISIKNGVYYTDLYYPTFYQDCYNTDIDIIKIQLPEIELATNTYYNMNLDNIYVPDFYKAHKVDFTFDTPDIQYPENNFIIPDTVTNNTTNSNSTSGVSLSNYQPTFQFD